ncbi:MAG: hypothetical protein CVV42_20615 [Candidatus Riflebacteria bacterium HGW-Riflebacteria-2]|nr:MAG: hypothetical protein CVV42_20615 [Candidatus Riflebacteria bacterium HGW-Riflebacteria-2]
MVTSFKISGFTCPACGTVFDARTVTSITHQGQDSDFLPHYLGENPLPYFLVQCPECSFSAYPEDYNDLTSFQNKISGTSIKKILSLPICRKIPEEAQKFFIAGKIYEETGRNPYHIGNLYLRGSWCCRISDNRKAEIEMQQMAVKFLRLAVEKSMINNPDNLPVVTYLIGELYRRLEDRKSAREWFSAVEEVLIDQEQQWILELTQKQAELNEHFIN